jgi:hypothetical protein
MMQVTLHRTPRERDVVLEQVRIVGLALRREALIGAIVLVIVTLVIGSEVVRGGPGFDSREAFPTALASFLFPFAVWKGERRFGPAFLWTLPVDRRRLALARVFAGWIWMMAALAVFAAWVLTLALLAHASPAQILMRIPFTATIATYLLGSALVLGLRHPLRWLLGAAGVIFLVGTLSEVLSHAGDREWQHVAGARSFFSAVERAAALWQTLPALGQWAILTLLGVGAGLAALWAAVSRHGDRWRH